jgi:hypothetical protein
MYHRGWRAVKAIGWIILLIGFVPVVRFVHSSVRNADYRMDDLRMFFVGCLLIFFGSVFVVVSRQSDL